MIATVTRPDSVTLAVIEAGLTAAADEMFAVLKKTTMSPIISEVLDAGTGITDATGRLLSSGAGIPSFVCVLDKAVTALIARRGDTLADGDMFITNDRAVANTLSMGFEVRRWPQCSAGNSKNASIASRSLVRLATPFSYLTPYFSQKPVSAVSASARWISSRSDFTAVAICLGKQFRTFFTLCTQ